VHLRVDTSNPFPIRRPLTAQLEPVRGGGVSPRDQALPSSRELGGFLDPNTLTRAIEDLERSGYRPLRPQSGGA
jgi:DNA-binding transcriptional regulator YhcF (GntR family)